MRGVTIPLHLDLGQGAADLAQIVGVSSTAADALRYRG
jgi:hypothetical protein